MSSKMMRVMGGAAALAALAIGFATSPASALPPGTPPNGAASLSPASGNSSTAMTVLPPSGAVCPGDTATGGYKWATFMVGAGIDPATLTYSSTGPASATAGFVQPLFTTGFSPIVNKNTAVTTGLVTGLSTSSLGLFAPGFVPAGSYQVGIACYLAGATVSYWSAPMTITTNVATGGPAQINFAYGATPSAPVLGGTLTAGDQSLDGSFTVAAAVPAITGYTVTAVPTSGPTVTLSLAAGATTFSLTGLVNGTQYAVSVVATNSVGDSAPSNTVNGTPNPAARPAVTSLSATPGTGNVTLGWVAPTGVAPLDYTIAVSPSVAGAPFTAAAGSTSFVVNGTPGTLYTFTVTPNHASPYVGTSASISATPNAAQVIIQDVTVVRPAGALVLTQRCGVYGALPAEGATPGFAALAALPASADTVGTAPTLTLGGSADPQFANYPSPASPNYPTHCGVDLGTAQYVTTGTLAGQYYAATGRINQVTVSDTRDTDTGWTVNGTMSDFDVVGGGSSFSGNYLGWSPVVTDDSDLTTAGYDQTAVAGASVLPTTAAGLATPKALASTASGAGLGIASFDARLKLLIPVSARAGTYNGTLTFTVV